MSRDFAQELDALKIQMNKIEELVGQIAHNHLNQASRIKADESDTISVENNQIGEDTGKVFYSGQYRGDKRRYRWEPQERHVGQLLDLDGDKVAKILSALGHKQRLDILRSVLKEPLTGAELVDRLNMGTTGQLYHHIKALQGADLLVQEERGGRYTLPGHRALPLLLLLAAVSDLLDTSDYIELTEARNNAGAYLGQSTDEYNSHLLLRSVLENAILEHQAGFCSQVNIFLHYDGSVTVADNGRGIPVQALPNTEKPRVQAVLTEISQYHSGSINAPNSEKGISIPIVNALSEKLTVEIRREGKVFRQEYKHGIPQTALLTVGVTNETGTSVTFLPDRDIFASTFNPSVVSEITNEIFVNYPRLSVQFNNCDMK
ncbi:ATP-binding protein [Paenibacillus sp. N3/727]|uniref:ATP-binding protein n=1 Tax=Paenibacillus sp. N3/727 TaxID=2925845 RepID=UPI001F52EE08|nr:ATP-binding protein [Paenibacillus sp. N3/727]UNK18317.1 ATP-binding protein [Paenibacillus sp. N3/727]